MATTDPFDLLGDNDNDDPSQLLAAQEQKVVPKKTLTPAQSNAQQKPPAAKLPGKPLPPAQAGDSRLAAQFSASHTFSGGYGYPSKSVRRKISRVVAGKGEHPRRQFERHCGSGRGSELKPDGSGHGNWGTPSDESDSETEEATSERSTSPEKQPGDEDVTVGNKENTAIEAEEKKTEDKVMTLEENQQVLEKKRKASQALKTEERKVALDEELESMQQLANKKGKSAIE